MAATRLREAGSAMPNETMSKVDTAWLRMESPTNLMMITGVLMIERPLDLTRLKKTIADRWLSFPRFRQKAVSSTAGALWEDDRDFDLDWHLRLTALPGKADQDDLARLVSNLASSPLDHSKPLWQFHLVERYQGGSALICRVHHCYADGLALVQVLLTLTDTDPKPQRKAHLAHTWLREDKGQVLDRLLTPAKAGVGRVFHAGKRALAQAMRVVNEPQIAQRLLNEGGLIAQELARAVLLSDDPPTRFKGPLGVSKRVAWMTPLRLDEVKVVSHALGCTVNDVLLASCAGALRAYLIDQGEAVDGLTIRVTVPVSLRPLEHARKLGNHFGLVFLELPIGEANPLRRLERVAANMRELKKSRQAIMSFGLLAALGVSPQRLQRPALQMLSRKASAVATNVPGPQQKLYLAGKPINQMMFWVPQSGSIGMGISILSYNGEVHFGLIADAKRVPQPGEVIRRFRPEFEKLLLITLMEDWQAPIEAADARATLEYFLSARLGAVAEPPAQRPRSAGTRAPATAGATAKRAPQSKPKSKPQSKPQSQPQAKPQSKRPAPAPSPKGRSAIQPAASASAADFPTAVAAFRRRGKRGAVD